MMGRAMGIGGLALLAAAACMRGRVAAGTAEARFGLRLPPVAFEPPAVRHAALPGGATVDCYEDASIPLATLLVRVGDGMVRDPAGKVGCAAMTAEVIRTGGTAALPGDELDRRLEARGAELTVSTEREETWFRLSVLKEDLAWGADVLAELLARPAFPAERLDEARARRIVGLAQRLDVPQDAAQALYPMLLWGRENPWAWTETSRTLAALVPEDLRAHHARWYRADRVQIGLAGAVSWDAARAAAERIAGALPAGGDPPPPLPDAPPVERPQVWIVPRPATQNVIILGHEGIGRRDPRLFESKVLGAVLSGGFTSRLIRQVRSDRGLAYAVYGQIGVGAVRGLYRNVALTRAESTTEALQLMLAINRDLVARPPEPDEIERAHEAETNGFVFFFDTPEKIVRQQISLDAYGYPPDYLRTYVARLRAAGASEVHAAARTLLHPERAVILIMGRVDPPVRQWLETLGPVRVLDEAEVRGAWL